MTREQLKQKREKLGLSQGELGRELGLTRDGIASMEQGRRPIRKLVELAVAQLFVRAERKGMVAQ